MRRDLLAQSLKAFATATGSRVHLGIADSAPQLTQKQNIVLMQCRFDDALRTLHHLLCAIRAGKIEHNSHSNVPIPMAFFPLASFYTRARIRCVKRRRWT
jgi:hypothetical protein